MILKWHPWTHASGDCPLGDGFWAAAQAAWFVNRDKIPSLLVVNFYTIV